MKTKKIKKENIFEIIPNYLMENSYFKVQLLSFLPAENETLYLSKYRGENYTVYWAGPFGVFSLNIMDSGLLEMEMQSESITFGIDYEDEYSAFIEKSSKIFSSLYTVKDKDGKYSISKRTVNVSDMGNHTKKTQEFEKINWDNLGNITKINKVTYVPEYLISRIREDKLILWNKDIVSEEEENWYYLNSAEAIGEIKTKGKSDSTYYFKSLSNEGDIETVEILPEEFSFHLNTYYANKLSQGSAHVLKKEKK